MSKKTILFIARSRLDNFYIQAIKGLSDSFNIIVLCSQHSTKYNKYVNLPNTIVKEPLSKYDIRNFKINDDILKELNEIENEIELNAFSSNANYLLYKKYAVTYFDRNDGFWENKYTLEYFYQSYKLLKSLITGYKIDYAIFETIDMIDTYVLDAFDKKGIIKTFYLHRNPLFGDIKINLASGLKKNNYFLDVLYKKDLIEDSFIEEARKKLALYEENFEEKEYDKLHKRSIFSKYPLFKYLSKITFTNLKYLYRRKIAKQYFSKKLPSKYIAYFLQHTPEASVFVQATKWNNQQNLIEQLAVSAKAGYSIVVKEHPKTYGRRPLSFYKELLMFPNIVLVSPFDNAKKISKNAKAVLTLTGSLGFDALIYKTKVFTLVDSFLTLCKAVKKINSPEEIWKFIDEDFYNKEEVIKLIAGRLMSSYSLSTNNKKGEFWLNNKENGNILAKAIKDNIQIHVKYGDEV